MYHYHFPFNKQTCFAKESFSSESGLSSSERGRSGSRKSTDVTSHSQRRGRSVSRVGSSGNNGGVRRLDADTESSRRRRSLSRNPSSTREITGGLDPGRSNSSRRRSVSRQPPRERVNSGEKSGGSAIRGRAIGADREKENSRRRQRSLSVVRRRIDNSEVKHTYTSCSFSVGPLCVV